MMMPTTEDVTTAIEEALKTRGLSIANTKVLWVEVGLDCIRFGFLAAPGVRVIEEVRYGARPS